MSKYVMDWVDIGFRPAPPGWTVAYLERDDAGEPTTVRVVPMPGWIVQRHDITEEAGLVVDDERPEHARRRQVVASVLWEDAPVAYPLWVEYIVGRTDAGPVLAPDALTPSVDEILDHGAAPNGQPR